LKNEEKHDSGVSVSVYVCKKLYTGDGSERSEVRRKEANNVERRKPKWKKPE
jgi:hypothetical protein